MAAHLLPYADLHEHLKKLEAAGLLIRVDRAINKDTEMHPLVRWQFRGGIAEKDRKAFLFTNVTDSKGRKYDIPVVVGALAASREIYRIGMDCPLEKINEVWTRGCSFAHLRPGFLSRYGPLLREPFGRVHWAGTETSTTSHGAMDGAVRSGERAAAEILDRA